MEGGHGFEIVMSFFIEIFGKTAGWEVVGDEDGVGLGGGG